MRTRAPEERSREGSSASSSTATSAAQERAQPTSTLGLPGQLPTADASQEEHAARLRTAGSEGGAGEVHGEIQATNRGLELLRAAALQKPFDSSAIVRGDPEGRHVMRVILGRTITIGVRG